MVPHLALCGTHSDRADREQRFAEILDELDYVVLLCFLVEITARVLTYFPTSSCSASIQPGIRTQIVGRIRYLLEPMNLIDLLAIVGYIRTPRAPRCASCAW